MTEHNNSNDHTTPNTASVAGTKPAEPAANIKFIGRDQWDAKKRKVLKTNDPIVSFVDPAEGEVKLPAAVDQVETRFFYHPKAALIAQTFPFLYILKK